MSTRPRPAPKQRTGDDVSKRKPPAKPKRYGVVEKPASEYGSSYVIGGQRPPLRIPDNCRVVTPKPGTVFGFVGAEAFRPKTPAVSPIPSTPVRKPK